jgi:hypothetical protein
MAGSGHDSGTRRRPGMIQSTVKALPKRLCISIGGFFGPCYEVTLEKGRLIYTYSARGPSGGEPKPEWPLEPKLRELMGLEPLSGPDEIQPSAEQWQNFRRTLNRLDVWCWQAKYSDPAVCDGTGWSAEIVYSDRSLVSSGDNCFPGRDGRAVSITVHEMDNTFERFSHAVARLVGREFH